MSDPYTIPLTSRQVPAARRLERMVADHVKRRGLPAAAATGTARPATSGVTLTHAPASRTTHVPAPPDGDLTAKLRDLAELHETGALTDDEFRRAKQTILGA